MSISPKTRKVLWTRAGDRCSFPRCDQQLTVDAIDAHTGGEFVTVVGEEAHIRSSKKGGPRYDPDFDPDRLDEYENLILLCSTHHTLIDDNNGAAYAVDNLLAMRRRHEKWQQRRESVTAGLNEYLADQYRADDKVLFEQVDLNGPSVDAMFVDVPFACRPDAKVAGLLRRIATEQPGDARPPADGQVVTGAAQALLHPDWSGSALIVGGPGQGKSTLLQYICQFHRARQLDRTGYSGAAGLTQLTEVTRIPVRIDLRDYAHWATAGAAGPHRQSTHTQAQQGPRPRNRSEHWPSIEEYLASEIQARSGGHQFSVGDLALVISTEPTLLAFDGLDEVADLKQRERVSVEITATHARLTVVAVDLVVLVATRPGGTSSELWSSPDFPILYLQRLSHGLRLQYLRRWAAVARLSSEALDRLQRTFLENRHVPHIDELASYPMQLAILLHLLYRRQLLPQQRTELYAEYLKTFLDREQREDKEPLLAEERTIIEKVHAIIAWHLQTRAEQGRSAGTISREDLRKLLRDELADSAHGLELAERLFSALTTRVLCLVERKPGTFQFEVQSLREYFAANHIFENVPTRGRGSSRDSCLTALLQRPYWSNVCRFFVGMFSKVEVRGIRHNLLELSENADLAHHPSLRSIAALFLNDRTYEGQNDAPVREIVDFILSGPGVVFAEDGLLDVSGSSLLLSERAGRAQAVEHLKARLVDEADPSMRRLLAQCLSRHTNDQDDPTGWWWDRYKPDLRWLSTAADLGALRALRPSQVDVVSELLGEVASDSIWRTELLSRGGYSGDADGILTMVLAELGDGAADVLAPGGLARPIGLLLEAAATALTPTSSGSTLSPGAPVTSRRTRQRSRGRDDRVLNEALNAAGQMRALLGQEQQEPRLAGHLRIVHQIWGDTWLMRRAIAAAPHTADLAAVATSLRRDRPDLADLITLEAEARACRGDIAWWRQRATTARSELDRRQWVLALLSGAHQHVVAALAPELSAFAEQLQPKHAQSLRAALRALSTSFGTRQLNLRDPLRLKEIILAPRALWLAREVTTDDSVEQIDKRLANGLQSVLQPGLGDARELIVTMTAPRTIKASLLRGAREALPPGEWASSVMIGTIRPTLAREILATPQEWPADLVQRAAEAASDRLASLTEPMAVTAADNHWFVPQ